MTNPRIYGKAPYSIAVIHGGPGAAGDLAPLAEELSKKFGILEPLQTRDSIEGQISELNDIITKEGTPRFTLIGHSWGAFLSYIYAGRFPDVVKKLILVSSAPFEDKYVTYYKLMRLSKLSASEKDELTNLELLLASNEASNKDKYFERLGELMSKSDSYDPIPHESTVIEARADINKKVWAEAKELRKNGELLYMGCKIRCPVIAIHGDYDPHPYEGVRDPLSKVIKDFRFILLEKCGHYPWFEKFAKDQFYRILINELKSHQS
jgi:pimeloyl-ACP methyl ester carboxylesterase